MRNLLGTPGAVGADLLMQLFGLAATVLVLPVAVWGWRIATHRPFDREWMRPSFWLAGTIFAAGFVACLPRANAGRCRRASAASSATPCCACRNWCWDRRPERRCWWPPGSSASARLAAVVVATGFGYHDPSDVKIDERWAREAAGPEDNDAERTSISLGWLAHGLLSIKTRIVRLVTRRAKSPARKTASRRAPTPAVSPRDRIEPRLDETAVDDDEVEEEEEEGRSDRGGAPACASLARKTGARARRLPAS